MTIYSAAGKAHDTLFGSKDLSIRGYDQFRKEAKIIGELLRYPNSKLSWSPGKTPSYECNYELSLVGHSYLSVQNLIRTTKTYVLPGFVADSLKASSNACEWSTALLNNYTMRERDGEIFGLAQKALFGQAELYQGSEKSQQITNFRNAAATLGQFINQQRIKTEVEGLQEAQQSLTPAEFRTFVILKRKTIQQQEWFKGLKQESLKVQELQKLLKEAPIGREAATVRVEEPADFFIDGVDDNHNPFGF